MSLPLIQQANSWVGCTSILLPVLRFLPNLTEPSSTLESSDDLLPDGYRTLLRQRLGRQVAASLVDLDLPGERKVMEPVGRLQPELAHPQPDRFVRAVLFLAGSPERMTDS